jgi:hypothetical protein
LEQAQKRRQCHNGHQDGTSESQGKAAECGANQGPGDKKKRRDTNTVLRGKSHKKLADGHPSLPFPLRISPSMFTAIKPVLHLASKQAHRSWHGTQC